jgi:hypothetical protein
VNPNDLAELERLTAEYAELMYPGMEVIGDLSDDEGNEMVRRAKNIAVRIADLVIQSGVLREVAA